ncbi:MAG: helix-turn-helix domain-containing protein [Bacilli bacterium]
MKELREIIGENLTELRKQKGYTQISLAEKLNYSDKAISKWENGSSLPPIDILLELANLYGVTLDYLVKDSSQKDKKLLKNDNVKRRNHILITLLSSVLVWIIATTVYVFSYIPTKEVSLWTIFLWAVPINAIVLIVFNGIWGKRKYLLPAVMLLIWPLLAAIHLQVLVLYPDINLWMIYLLGIPLTVATFLWCKLK